MSSAPRDRLLRAAVEVVADRGISDLSLRQLAAALGTSHRMLVYHFGSKEGLLVAVVQAVEEMQRQALADLDDASLSPVEMGVRLWQRLSDPALWPYERLFFEVYGQALQGRPHSTALLSGIVDTWLEPITALNERNGMAPDVARSTARLSIAVTRGLLLDLLATGEREEVGAAMDRFLEMYLAATPRPGHDG